MVVDKKLKCVIICGGHGKRLLPYTLNIHKSLIPINGKPILGHIVDYFKKITNDFMFIFEKDNKGLKEYIETLPVNLTYYIEEKPRGIGNALSFAKDFVEDKLIVTLGDCIFNGNIKIPKDTDHAFWVIKANSPEEIKRSYSVEIKNDMAVRVVEKPTEVPNNLCGMGLYFFSRSVFDHIKNTNLSPRTGRLEITDVIQTIISSGEKVKPILFEGDYINITYPEDLEKAGKILS